MILPERPQYRHSDENMLPLINIVFLLLIFFIIAGAITAADAQNIIPPESFEGEGQPLADRVLLIGVDGRIDWNGEVADLDSINSLFLGIDEVPEMLQVKADAQLSSEELFDLMRGLRESGVQRIKLLAVGFDNSAQ